MNWNELFADWQQQYNRDSNITHYDTCFNNKDTLIVCLGDSWTWGDSLDDRLNQFYCRHLANHYNADYINAGFRGFSNSWSLFIGNLIIDQVKNLNYKDIIVVATLTENGRDVRCNVVFDFDYISHFKNHGVSASSYYEVLQLMQACWQNQIKNLLAKFDSRFRFFVGQNFVWNDFYHDLDKSIVTSDSNWIEVLADYQNMPRPLRTNLVTSWVFDQVNEINSIAQISDTAVYKEWILPYIDRAYQVNQWLDASQLNHKYGSKHPTAVAHKLWADHIIQAFQNAKTVDHLATNMLN